MDRFENECLLYFRSEKIWARIFKAFRKKYISYGYFTGTVKITGLSFEDVEVLEGFFGKNFHGKKSASISAVSFEKALSLSRFRDISVEHLLELYFGEPVQGKRQQEAAWQNQCERIWNDFTERYSGTRAEEFFPIIKEEIKVIRKEPLEHWNEQLELAANIIAALPYHTNRIEYLAIFASHVTGNPHAFDAGTLSGSLLHRLVERIVEKRQISLPENKVFPSLKRHRSYLSVGLMLDHVSNYIMFYGISAKKKDGAMHSGIEGFLQEKDMVQVPLAVLAKWEKIECPNQRIRIVENPSIFAMLCEKATGDEAYMCMNGQPRFSAILSLELLARSGTKIYYAGDLDPEGLLIAQKLASYYSGPFEYWHMSEEDYQKARSGEVISNKRLKILDRITDSRLMGVADAIAASKTAGYQESIFE
ncbi:MAG: TIGR02679 domain-containing protein [Eubacterium sp.]|nr:TIGR02679 domain-containing protein [Eubacterium sp.]